MTNDLQQSADDEAAFWRGFIEWWVREREGPIPARVWDALRQAESRRGTPGAAPAAPVSPTGRPSRRRLN